MSSIWDFEWIFCESKIGKDIGGFYIGMHWKTPVLVCDWCKMCMEDLVCQPC